MTGQATMMHQPGIISTLMTVIYLALPAHARKVTNPSKVPRNAVLLSKIASLTLRGNKLTSSRRVKPIPQLECVGPDHVCALYRVDLMRCKNEGADYDDENIQWSCKASLPEEFKLGSTGVVCEGYESSDDPYILKGSCGVEYRLLLTEKGLQKYGHQYDENYMPRSASSSGFSKFGGAVFAAIFLSVLFIIVRSIYRETTIRGPRRGARHNRPSGGGGGGGGGNDDDPPPPYDGPPAYTRFQPRKKNTTSPGPSTTQSSTASPSQTRAQPRGGSWRPGFWTGALTGAAAGYGAYRYANQPQPQTQPQEQHDHPQTFFGSRRTPSSSSGSRFSPSYSSERHESTGFGGTRRR